MAWRSDVGVPEGYARAPTAAGLGGGKLGRAAQRELDGRAGRPETLPRGRRSSWESLGRQTLREERLGPAPEPEAAL